MRQISHFSIMLLHASRMRSGFQAQPRLHLFGHVDHILLWHHYRDLANISEASNTSEGLNSISIPAKLLLHDQVYARLFTAAPEIETADGFFAQDDSSEGLQISCVNLQDVLVDV